MWESSWILEVAVVEGWLEPKDIPYFQIQHLTGMPCAIKTFGQKSFLKWDPVIKGWIFMLKMTNKHKQIRCSETEKTNK